MSLKYFGTDGIRGEYGGETLNDEIAYRAGRAAVIVAKSEYGIKEPSIIVGRDTRASGTALLAAFAKGVCVEGGRVLDLGVAPTPCVAFAANASDAVIACSLTASHNPAKDNGIKFFQGTGVKPSEKLEQALDDAIDEVGLDGYAKATLECEDVAYLKSEYETAIIAHFPKNFLKGKRVALDCANGAMHAIAPRVFKALGAEVDVVAFQPNGSNINDAVGSEHPESLGALYSSSKYDLGFAFDGDGDRVILSSEDGCRLSGESLLAVLAIDAQDSGKLSSSVLVTTIQSNLGLDSVLRTRGIEVVRTDVGDKHIARLMLENSYSLGGEESGHLVLGEFAVTGDGLFGAVKLSEIVVRLGKPVSQLTAAYIPFPQKTVAIKVLEKPPLDSCPNLIACMTALNAAFNGEGRLLVRYSGTEPKLRLLVEAKSIELVSESMAALLNAAKMDLKLS